MPINDNTAQRRAIAAQQRAIAAQQRAIAARRRVRFVARNGAVRKILQFFENRTPAAWGALWYLLLSIIGVTYSWAFYSQYKDIHIFDFFGTSDFLLSAFQNVPMLASGIIATLISIGILIYRAYDSIVYSAYKSDVEEKKARIRLEAFILLFIILVPIIIGLLCYYFSICRLVQISTGILAFLLLSLSPFLFLTYRFFRRILNPISGDKQRVQINWDTGILLFTILAEAAFILPFLHGRSDGEAVKKGENRRVQVVLRQDSVQPRTRLPDPDRTLFLGTTSSFHLFYECGDTLNSGTDSKGPNGPKASGAQHPQGASECEKGRPFIVPTANIASLEFYQDPAICAASATPEANVACPESDPEDGSDAPRVGLSHVIDAITALNTTISKLKFNAIFQMESGNVILDATDVAKAVTALNQTIAEFEQLIVSDPAQSAQIVKALTALDKTISGFQPSVDPAQIVEAIETNTTKITTAIEGIYIPPEVQNYCGLGWERVATIGPFREGKHDKMEGREGGKKENAKESPSELVILDKLLHDLDSLFEAGTLQQLMLVGRVDITQLDENQRKYYGSNNGLAQARAKRVLDELVEKWASNNTEKKALLERTILLSAGPLHVGQGEEDPTDTDRAKDRSVEVWACGGAET